MRSTVDDALSVVGVTITRSAALNIRLGGVIKVDEDRTTSASVVTTRTAARAAGNSVVFLLVANDGVRTSSNTLGDVEPRNILLDIKDLGVLRRELEQLLQVEKLNTVTNTLGSDEECVANLLDLTPDDRVVVGWQAAKVLELTILGDFRERSAIGLTNSNELTALVNPTP
jgi:hypothetical protein